MSGPTLGRWTGEGPVSRPDLDFLLTVTDGSGVSKGRHRGVGEVLWKCQTSCIDFILNFILCSDRNFHPPFF